MAYDTRSVDKLRIRDARASGLDVLGPLSAPLTSTASGAASAPKGNGLTRRERKVKDILLQELNKINGTTNTWAAYKAKKHLTDGLDVAYIDRKIAKMEGQLRQFPRAQIAMAILWLAFLGIHLVDIAITGWADYKVLNLFVVALGLGSAGFGVYHSRRATRRRLWIYQALRELSDADDEGVQLDESVRLADLLIDRIIDQEEGAAPAPLHRIRTH